MDIKRQDEQVVSVPPLPWLKEYLNFELLNGTTTNTTTIVDKLFVFVLE